MPDHGDVSAVGTVEAAYGAPLTVGVYRGHVNIAGRRLDEAQCEKFAELFARARREAGRDAREVPGG